LDINRRLAFKPGEKFSHDCSGKISTPALGSEAIYFSVIIDYATGRMDIKLLNNLTQARTHIKQYILTTEMELNIKVKQFKADNHRAVGALKEL
jgi:hypothetical protein